MKKACFITLTILAAVVVLFFVDKKVCMRQRVIRHQLWEHVGYTNGGDRIRGDFIVIPQNVLFRNNMMILEYPIGHNIQQNDTLILNYQYFDIMKVTDPKTGKTGKYSMKGASWVDYLVGR
jgi:hypothetical protein